MYCHLYIVTFDGNWHVRMLDRRADGAHLLNVQVYPAYWVRCASERLTRLDLIMLNLKRCFRKDHAFVMAIA